MLQPTPPLTAGVPASGVAILMAVPFNADSPKLFGEPVSVVSDAAAAAWATDSAVVYTPRTGPSSPTS